MFLLKYWENSTLCPLIFLEKPPLGLMDKEAFAWSVNRLVFKCINDTWAVCDPRIGQLFGTAIVTLLFLFVW